MLQFWADSKQLKNVLSVLLGICLVVLVGMVSDEIPGTPLAKGESCFTASLSGVDLLDENACESVEKVLPKTVEYLRLSFLSRSTTRENTQADIEKIKAEESLWHFDLLHFLVECEVLFAFLLCTSLEWNMRQLLCWHYAQKTDGKPYSVAYI